MSGGSPYEGLCVLDKPGGLTSHDVVARVRRIAGTRKVGHAGTLDPMATGVLVCGIGRATRLLGHLALGDKAYRATIRLGASTSTDDAQGERVSGNPASGLDLAEVRARMSELTGRIEQVPSAVSAIKVNGERAYARVRAGEDVVLAARQVEVPVFSCLSAAVDGDYLDLEVEVECSSGTYVRALARDLGAALGVGGHLTALRRTRVGPFPLTEAVTLEQLADAPVVLDLPAALRRCFPVRSVDAAGAVELSHGRSLAPSGVDGPVGVLGPHGQALALVRDSAGAARPMLVLEPAAPPSVAG